MLTQLYAEALRPLGLRATQFTILQVLECSGEISQGGLGELARDRQHDPDQDTASDGPARWIAERRGTDRRKRIARRDTD